MKRLYKILLISLFITAIYTVYSYGASDFTYTLDSSGNATITAYKGSESNLTIPNMIDGHNVTTIGPHAFHEDRNSTNGNIIKNLVISEGIKRIEGFAFVDCKNLESVKLPESLIYMDFQLFIGCEKLENINIPHNLTMLCTGVLEQTAIKEIIIPENIQKFVGSEFRNCRNLKKVFIHNNNIDYYNNGFDTDVFEGCDSIVLYGNEGSTTQTYAQQKGLQFKLLSEAEEDIEITSITLNKTSLTLTKGNSEDLIATILPNNATDKTLIWSSSNADVASVENGKVTAKTGGTATITVSNSDGTKKATCNVTVYSKDGDSTDVAITSIILNKTSLTLTKGNSEQLIATILPNNATDKTLIWSSSNSNVASVENGKITAKNVGTATITVSNLDGTKKATCNISVVKQNIDSEKKEDGTLVSGKLPQTGMNYILPILLILVIIIAAVLYKHYKDLRNI